MNENAFRAPKKMQSKVGRKPLGDVANSSKLLAKGKSSAKNFTVLRLKRRFISLKTVRKPLDDLTNSNNPCATEKSSKKICINENLSIVNEEKVHNWAAGEGFLHNHNECVKAERQSLGMGMDYFLETVGLKIDLSMSISIHYVPKVPTTINLELNIPMVLDELKIDEFDICSPVTPRTAPTPRSPDMD